MNTEIRKSIHDAIVSLADGDRRGVPTLVEKLWPVLLHFAQRGIGNAVDAEDVAQEVFLRLCSRISEFDRSRDGVSWAFGIAHYEILTHRRRVQRRREHPSDRHPAAADPKVSHEDQLIHDELLAALAAAVGDLSDEDRRALDLLPGDDGRVRGSTLRKRKQRALARLRILWREIHG